jgi:hypothetical protein
MKYNKNYFFVQMIKGTYLIFKKFKNNMLVYPIVSEQALATSNKCVLFLVVVVVYLEIVTSEFTFTIARAKSRTRTVY